MSSDVDKIKDRLGIADVVGSYIKLHKAGKNFKAICPFHNEKTPSFFVSPERDSYYCFGCNVKGDIFTFVQEFEGLDFLGALKLLAPRAGVILKNSTGKNKELEKLYSILEKSSLLFEKNLKQNENALNYLKERGVLSDTISDFRIGFASDSWDNLISYLLEKNFDQEGIEKVGLLKKTKKEGSSQKEKLYDTFRNRIIFPTFDNAGRIIAFSGRFIGKKEDFIPKYLNSPETVLFNKSNTLYGYDKAKQYIRKSGYCILVEGQFDLVLSHQAGFKNTIAISGTSFTNYHADLIKKLTDKMIIAFDSDSAGINSAKRASELALSKGIDTKVANIPKDKDPADIILENKNEWKNIIKNSLSSIEFFINLISKSTQEKRDFWNKIRVIVLPLITKIQNEIDKVHFINLTSSKTGIPEDAISKEIKKIEEQIDKIPNIKESFEKNVTFVTSKKQKILERIKGMILWNDTLKEKFIDKEEVLKELEEIIKERINLEESVNENKLIFEMETIFQDSGKDKVNEELSELFKYLKEEKLKEDLENINFKLKEAESNKNSNEVEELLKKHKEIYLKIEKNKQDA